MLSWEKEIVILIKRFIGALQSGSAAARLGVFIKGIAPFTRLVDRLFFKKIVRLLLLMNFLVA